MLLGSIAYIVSFVSTGLLRVIYPYPVDGLDPGSLREIARIVAGKPLYAEPTLEYVPFIYGPGFFYVGAAVAKLIGTSFAAVRLVSFVASCGSIALVVLLVRRETRSWMTGLLGGGLFAACSRLADRSMDVGRMDALTVFFLLGAIVLARETCLGAKATWRLAAAAGVLAGCAVLTKQSSAPVLLALIVTVALLRPRHVLAFAVVALLTVAVPIAALTLQSGPWPLFYMWQLPRRHEIGLELIPRFWDDLLDRFTLPLLVAPVFLIARVLARDRPRTIFYGLVSVAMLAIAWVSRSNIGGALNVELPAYAMLSVLFGLALYRAFDPSDGWWRTMGSRGQAFQGYVLVLAVGQLALMAYNPRLMVPERSDAWGGDRLTATLASLPGPIFAAGFTGYAPEDAVQPDLSAVSELLGVYGGPTLPEGKGWTDRYAQALHDGRFTYVIIDPDSADFFASGLARDQGYVDLGQLFPDDDPYWQWPPAGCPSRPVRPARSGGSRAARTALKPRILSAAQCGVTLSRTEHSWPPA